MPDTRAHAMTTGHMPAQSLVLLCGLSVLTGASFPTARTARARFVVGLAFPAEHSQGVTWPYESLPPAPYDWLVMVVDEMPRAPGIRGETLAPSRDLRVFGRPPQPTGALTQRVADLPGQPGRHFAVRLEQGRLRLSLAPANGRRMTDAHGFVRVRLYHLTRPPPSPP
jgi:hypothetical protein